MFEKMLIKVAINSDSGAMLLIISEKSVNSLPHMRKLRRAADGIEV
jgi:hypothetical protein